MPKILVIEDEQIVRRNILELLNAEGFETIEAEDGQVGVRLAQEHIPDLIICDVMMPQLDGFSVLQVLHQNSLTETIPLIFLTAKSDWAAFRQGMALGADDYLTKPFTRSELLEAIAARLTKQAAVVQLRQKVDQLQQSNAVKEEFVSTAAHELRGPLANIRMAIELLQTSTDSSDRQFYLEILQSACEREVELINDLLDLQRLEEPPKENYHEVVDLRNWLPALVEPFQVRAETRQQTIHVNVLDGVPPLFTDYLGLQRILSELLNNACKYTEPGGKITVEAFLKAIEDPLERMTKRVPVPSVMSAAAPNCYSSLLRIAICNNAEIPANALPRLFDRFYRVPGGDRWNQGGTGLGLALVKKLAERLGGTIEVASETNWTVFTVQLPIVTEARD